MSLSDWWAKSTKRAAASIDKRGITGTLRLIPPLIRVSVRGYSEKRFDRRFGVDTAGVFQPVELASDPKFRYSNWYAPTAPAAFRRMLAHIKVDFRQFVFVDFGCGKGRALLLASRLPFRQIVGVELCPELHAVAEANLKQYKGRQRCTTIRLHCMDASDFSFPGDPGIYYFYDPFHEPVLAKVLSSMRQSLAASPRVAYVVYCEPGGTTLLDASGFLTLLKRTPHYAIYRAGLA